MNQKFFTTLSDFQQWVEQLQAQGTFSKVAFDTELEEGLNWDRMKLQGISFCNGEEACYFDVTQLEFEPVRIYLKTVFKSLSKLIGHNLPYDLKVLQRFDIIHSSEVTKQVFDTMTAAHLINENGPKGLKDLVLIYGIAKSCEIIKWKDINKYPPSSEQFYNYAINDAIWTWQLHEILGSKLKQQNLLDLFFKIEMPFLFVLVEIESNGIILDLSKIQDLRYKMSKLKIDYEIKMLNLLKLKHIIQYNFFGSPEYLSPVNFNSSPQLIKIIEKFGLTLTLKTEADNKSVNKESLLSLSGQHPFIDLLREYRAVEKLLNGFLNTLPNHICFDGRIRASFNNTGTVTGRLSSSNPNLQQIPKNKKSVGANIRECFVASSGKKLVVGDYSGQELRVLTEVTKDPGLIECFMKGRDLHLTTANKIFKLKIPDSCLFDSHSEYESYKSKYKDARHKAKNKVVFPIIYGTTPYGVSKSFNISEEKAKTYIDGFFSLYPKVKTAIFETIKQIKTYGFVKNLVNRRRRFTEINGYAIRQAFNFRIQGFSSDMIRLASIRILDEIHKHPNWGMNFLLIVHDEVVLEVDEQFAEETKKLVKHCMETAVKFCIPIVADVGEGSDYATAKP